MRIIKQFVLQVTVLLAALDLSAQEVVFSPTLVFPTPTISCTSSLPNHLALELDTIFVYASHTPLLEVQVEYLCSLFSAPILVKKQLSDQVNLVVHQVDAKQLQKFGQEYYRISVSESRINIYVSKELGSFSHAMESLSQLALRESDRLLFPKVEIEDAPKFKWRGLLLDVCRRFVPMTAIYRTVDAMAACKMNVLHLHLSDDQAFRLECKSFPLLHEMGSGGLYYTQQEIRLLISYAKTRGITVVPEFDMPGHTTAWLYAYPKFSSGSTPAAIECGYGIFKPVMNPIEKSLYKHLDLFFSEMATLFPSPYFHIGGDEVRSDDWLKNEKIAAFMKSRGDTIVAQLQQYFNARIEKILHKYHKSLIGWDEILEGQPAKSSIIQSWRGKEYHEKAIEQGYTVIRSNGFYLDQTYSPAEYYYRADSTASTFYLGAEAALWSELVDSLTIDSRLWPSTAAVAARYWGSFTVDSITFYRELSAFNSYLQREVLGEFAHSARLQLLHDSDLSPYVFALFDFVRPIDGYKRHKLIKQDKAYNCHYRLNTFADYGSPCSQAYIDLLLLLNSYQENPNDSNRVALQAIFQNWKTVARMYVDIPTAAVHNVELTNLLIMFVYCAEAGEFWMEGESKKAAALITKADEMQKGLSYELVPIRFFKKILQLN